MFKYIKWELINFFNKKWKFGAIVLALFAVVLVMNFDASEDFTNLIMLPFTIVMTILFISIFIGGTTTVVKSFSKPTYMLESMIAYSPAKILLAKYVLAIIINIIYLVLTLIGVAIIIFKLSDVEFFKILFDALKQLDVLNISLYVINLFISAINFTALLVMAFVLSKVIAPNKKGSTALGFVIWWIVSYFQQSIIQQMFGTNNFYSSNELLILVLINTALIGLYYLITVKLIENKLEIYS